jgi:putative colanic acid biosysnthesis UDP-glucose lipid carrier transferase
MNLMNRPYQVQSHTGVHKAATSRAKRLLDIGFSLAALVLLLPLLLLVAVVIKVESPGPALFRQRRGGLHGETFVILKFRTMRTQEDGDTVDQVVWGDPRVTRFGALLRHTCMDELPQFWNVLHGEMSVVGPRPHALAHDRVHDLTHPDYAFRFAVKPGLTGLAQVKGYRGEISAPSGIAARLACDLDYIANWSFMLDLKLIAQTICMAVRTPA